MQVSNGMKITLTPLIIITIFIAAWILQNQYMFNPDVSSLLRMSQILLAGGGYGIDFFEVNPPLILYLYMPAAELAKLTHLPVDTAFYIYIFSLSGLSLLFCYDLLKKIFIEGFAFIAPLFLFVLSFVFLIAPIGMIGQREHLMLMLAMPYLILASIEANDHPNSIDLWKKIAIGTLAGVGFCIKPYFLLTPALVELYLFCKKRKNHTFVRPETSMMAVVIASYLLTIVIFNKNYLSIVLPLMSSIYYQHVGVSFRQILIKDQIIFTLLTLIFFSLRYYYTSYKNLCAILAITATSITIGYILQRTGWLYQSEPIIAIDTLLLFLLFTSIILQKKISSKEYIALSIFTVVMLSFYLIFQKITWISLTLYTASYSVFFFLMILSLFVIARKKQSIPDIIARVMIIITISNCYFYYSFFTSTEHIFLSNLILIGMLFLLLVPERKLTEKLHWLFLCVLGTLLFTYTCFSLRLHHDSLMGIKSTYTSIIEVIKPYTYQPFAILASPEVSAPIPAYPQQVALFGGGGFYWLSDKNLQSHTNKIQPFLDGLAHDFNKYRPTFLIVSTLKSKKDKENFLIIFSLSPELKKIWGHYRYITSIDQSPYYRYNVYGYHQ